MTPIRFPYADRLQHLYICGKSGYGKSCLIRAMASQDIQQGKGITVLDPKGDLVDNLLGWVPENRIKDVIYLSSQTPVPLNLMSYAEDGRILVLQDVVGLLKRFIHDMGERMEPVVKEATDAVLLAGGSFFDIHTFLSDPDFRKQVLLRVHDKDVLHFWNVEFPTPYYRGAEQPIVSRLTDFKKIPALRKVLGNRHATLSVNDIVSKNMILLVNLGSFGEVAAPLLGTIITSQIQQAIFRRQPIPEKQRVPYFLYADEFQEFKNASFNKILKLARGFGLGLTLANLHPKDAAIKDIIEDIKGCISSYVLFHMNIGQAMELKHEVSIYEEVATLSEFKAIYRAADRTSTIINTPRPATRAGYADRIIKRMHDLIACNSPSESHTEGNDPDVPPSGIPLPHPKPDGRATRDESAGGAGKPEPPLSRGKS